MSKANKKKRNRKIKSLVLLLFLTIVMLSTATYAWFTSNRTVRIDTINVNIAATSGLQISADAANWKALLSNSDLTTGYSGNTNFIPSTGQSLSPVSTAGAVSSGKLVFYSGTVEGDSQGRMALTTAATNDASGLYVVFDIFLKTDQAAVVYLEKGSGVKGLTSGDTTKGLQNAARYAFLTLGNGASTTTQATAIAWPGSNTVTPATDLTIVEPNYDTHTQNGLDNGSRYYNYSSGQLPSLTGATPVPWLGVNGAVTNVLLPSTNYPGLSATQSTGDFIVPAGTIYKTDNAYSSSTSSSYKYIKNDGSAQTNLYVPVFDTLDAGITKVRVYMWIEGQDLDCENNASGTDLTYDIILTLDDPGRSTP